MNEPGVKFDILARTLLAKGKFLDPVTVLREWRKIQLAIASSDFDWRRAQSQNPPTS